MTHAAPDNPLGLSEPHRPVLVTGGAGFIGTNMTRWLLRHGYRVALLDDLSRPGVRHNLAALRALAPPDRLQVHIADVRQPAMLDQLARQVSAVFHFAAQVAVTRSLNDPVHDFDVNARGTLMLLEALRRSNARPPLLFTSTNKVYGPLEHIALETGTTRYQPLDPIIQQAGIDEQTLAFHSPYGCSKGAADQYVLDYARSYDLPTIVLRMSCIYGPHQHGNEDQGWVAHFVRSALHDQPLSLYGDGKQVRDLLFIDDLIDAMRLAVSQIDQLRGKAFNVGGGPARAISLLELMQLLHQLHGSQPSIAFEPWRPGDQRYYVSNIKQFAQHTGWQPRTSVRAGLLQLYRWFASQRLHHPMPQPSIGSVA